MRHLILLSLCCIGSIAFSQEIPPPSEKQVDMNEVYRRGNTTIVVGEGPRSGPKENFIEAMEIPKDDSNMWFITVWSKKGCQPCIKLKHDFENAPELLAWVASPNEQQNAWAHFNIYDGEDETQAWRRKAFKVERYPTIIIQPPLDYTWGDPGNVVFYQIGYDGTPIHLAEAMSKNVKTYIDVMTQKGYPQPPKQVPLHSLEEEGEQPVPLQSEPLKELKAEDNKSTMLLSPLEGTEGLLKVNHASLITPLLGQQAPFNPPTRPDTYNPNLQPNNQVPQVYPIDPNQQNQNNNQQQNQNNQDLQTIKDIVSSPAITNLIIVGYLIFNIFTSWQLKNNPQLLQLTPQQKLLVDRSVSTTLQKTRQQQSPQTLDPSEDL